jgi:hypothetical protein
MKRERILYKIQKDIRSRKFILSVLVVFMLLSLILHVKINPTPLYNEYEFWVTTNSEIKMGDFQLFYDFDSQKGTIEFKAMKTQNLEWIKIKLPPSLRVSDYSIIKNGQMINDFQTDIEDNRIYFDDFSPAIEASRFVIDFHKKNEDLEPHGKFSVHTIADEVYSKFEEGLGRSRIKFNLGKYSCDEPCFYEIADTEPPRIIDKNMLFLESETETKLDVKSKIFILRTFNSFKMILKEASLAIFTGFLVGIIFLITEWIGEHREKP